MIIIRLIILIALVGLVIYAYRKLTTGSESSNGTEAGTPAMKKCAHCGMHLPQSEALQHKELYFCSAEHQKVYLEQHPHDGE